MNASSKTAPTYALVVRQPWAACIFGLAPFIEAALCQRKDVENRGVRAKHRGDLWILAGKEFDEDALAALWPDWYREEPELLRGEFARGVLLGRVQLADVVDDSDSLWALEGCWHWKLERPEVLAIPVAFRGMPGLMRIDGEAGRLSGMTLMPPAEYKLYRRALSAGREKGKSSTDCSD